MNALRIGTRGSPLALWQARYVAARLQPWAPSHSVELVEILTAGDQVRDRPLSQFGGEGLFTKEIQRALLDGRVDIAVHSLKDLPTIPVPGLLLAAVPERGPVADVLISRLYRSFDQLPRQAVVATCSLRRRAQILHRRPDLKLIDMRGNVETRLRKLQEPNIDGLILAQAGLERLGRGDAISEILYPGWMLPAVGQGALGLECRGEDGTTRCLVQNLDHFPTRQAVLAERALLRELGGGCLVPIGVSTEMHDTTLTLRAAVLSPDGQNRVEGQFAGLLPAAEDLGRQLAQDLLGQGARELLVGSTLIPK